MVQLEELVDDTKGKLKLSEDGGSSSSGSMSTGNSSQAAPAARPKTAEAAAAASTTTAAAAAAGTARAVGPELPPSLAATSGKTADEMMAELNKLPLFMTELEENDDVAALQALAYEGTPRENADDFRQRGNECFAARRHADAQQFYDKGVQILEAEERRRRQAGDGPTPAPANDDSDDEVRAQRAVLEMLLVNRAACHLALGNYRQCTLDCAGALRLNVRNAKALYRSARALLAVGKTAEAADACARALALEPENKTLASLAAEIGRKSDELAEKRTKEEARLAADKRSAALLKATLRARGIRTRATAQPPEMEDAAIRLRPRDPEDASGGGSLAFPAVLLYPAHLQSDFIKSFGEEDTLAHHLDYILPPPWDGGEAEYANLAAVECYMETATGGLVKVGKKMPLLKILTGANVEVVDDLVTFYVLPRAKADAWVKDFKAKRTAENKTV